MFKCECGREFTRAQGLGYHKKFCGKNRIFYDNGYECKIGSDGNIVYIHREVMEQKLGRKLVPGEIVHHIDENKRNNKPDNLELTNVKEHAKHHHPDGKPNNLKIQWGVKIMGSTNGSSKFTEDQVLNIRERLKIESVKYIANEFKVGYRTILAIKNRDSWKHI